MGHQESNIIDILKTMPLIMQDNVDLILFGSLDVSTIKLASA